MGGPPPAQARPDLVGGHPAAAADRRVRRRAGGPRSGGAGLGARQRRRAPDLPVPRARVGGDREPDRRSSTSRRCSTATSWRRATRPRTSSTRWRTRAGGTRCGCSSAGCSSPLWAGRSLAKVLAACSAAAWRLPASQAKVTVVAALALSGIVFVEVVASTIVASIRDLGGAPAWALSWGTLVAITGRGLVPRAAHAPARRERPGRAAARAPSSSGVVQGSVQAVLQATRKAGSRAPSTPTATSPSPSPSSATSSSSGGS